MVSSGKTIANLKRAKYDDESVIRTQLTDITNRKVDVNSLLTRSLKSRLIIPDHDSSNFSEQDV